MASHGLLVEPDAGLADEIQRAFAPLGLSMTAAQAGEAAVEAHRVTRSRADDPVRPPFEVADLLARPADLVQAARPGLRRSPGGRP